MSGYLLKLFVAGRNARSQQAIENLKNIMDDKYSGRYQLEVIDIMENPQAAEEHKILATPAVIRRLPLPMRRVIGDLSDQEQVIMGLNLKYLDE